MTATTQRLVDELKQKTTDIIDDIQGLIDDGCDTDDAAYGRAQVAAVGDSYAALLAPLEASEKTEVQRAVGLALEKLKGLASRLP